MSNCGCPGNWLVTGRARGDSWVDYPIPGYEYDNPRFTNDGTWSYYYSTCDDRNMTVPHWNYADAVSTSIRFVKSDPNCVSGPPPGQKYDCLNGNCEPNTKYKTPGFFASLEDCQTACSIQSSDKICLDKSEYSTIISKINNLQNLIC